MKNVLIIIAPFGFGPAANGLCVADCLANRAHLTLVTTGSAYTFISGAAPVGSRCLDGRIYDLFTNRDLFQFDLIVSINNVPAANALCKAGFGTRLVFFDTLLQWRGRTNIVKSDGTMLAYLVQDFPGAADRLRRCHAQNVQLVAPVVWKRKAPADRSSERRGATICLGGVTSPVVSWQSIRSQLLALLTATFEACSRHKLHLTVIGSEYLQELSVGNPESVSVRSRLLQVAKSRLIDQS